MKSAHNLHPLIALILILVAVAFLIGTLRVFRRAHAAVSTSANAYLNGQIVTALNLTPTLAQTETESGIEPTPVPTEADTDIPLRSTPTVVPVSADTTGIIALAIVIVTTILVGAIWGVRRSPQMKTPPR